MKTWLDKLCEPLEHPKYPQVRNYLIKVEPLTGKIIGKCAEGEIACQNGLKIRPAQLALSSSEFHELGVPDDLTFGLPSLDIYDGALSDTSSIGGYIVGLNDDEYTYTEIVEFLRTTFEDAV